MSRKRSHKEVDSASDVEDQTETGLSHPQFLDDDPFLDTVESVNARASYMPEEDRSLVLSVFNAVWDEFDSWREGWNEDQLIDLGVNNLSFEQDTSLYGSESDSSPQSSSLLSDDSDMDYFAPSAQVNGTRTFQVYTVNDTQDGLDSRDLATFSTTLATNEIAGQPSDGDDDDPVFETYAPINRSIFTGDDSDDLPFIPFADEFDEYSVEPSEQPADNSAQTRRFPYRKHMERHMHLRWQTQMPDPDADIVFLETAYRLMFEYGITPCQVDESRVLCDSTWYNLCSEINGYSGIIDRATKRDFLPWPTFTPNKINSLVDAVIAPMVPDKYDMMGQIRSSFKYFCPNPNCIDMVCPAHQTRNIVPPLQYSSKISQNELLNQMESRGGKTQSCKRTCFSSNPLLDADGIAWDETAKDELRIVLGMDADALPCDLAVMMRKPCAECFALRPLFLSKVDEKAKKKGQNKQTPKFKDTEPPEEWTPNDPCTHEGDCTNSNCECYKNDAHCGRNCHCSKRCKRRWPGCTCSKSKRRNLCRTNDCPCWRAHRECDPELCTRCGAKNLFDDKCKNTAIQQNYIKRTELRNATYGLGLFLAADETAQEGDFIMEYVGELVYDATAESRQDVAKYLGRNYFYRLNETLNIDASRVGNEARFINHAHSWQVNCHAEVLLVNGEHRIGIFAAKYIEANEELFLDYGPGFFIHDSDDESQSRVHGDPDTIKAED